MTARPKISVLIPTYNYARFLPEALDSVWMQDFADFEVVIGDDGSNDGSVDVIRRYAAQDPRIRLQVHESNLGMVANWNWCLREARGDYVKFLFADDRFMSSRALGRMAAALDAEPRAVLAVSARAILDENSRQVEVWDELGAAGWHRGLDVIGQCLRRQRNLVGEPSAVMFRRAAGRRGFDPAWRQLVDQEMWFHLLAQGDLAYDPEPLCAFRCHSGQQTVANRQNQIGSMESLLLTARYLDQYAVALGLKPDSLAMKRLLFRSIYYARKDYGRGPVVAEAEAIVLPRIGPGWFRICWAMHRLMKPLENLCRSRRQRSVKRPYQAEAAPAPPKVPAEPGTRA